MLVDRRLDPRKNAEGYLKKEESDAELEIMYTGMCGSLLMTACILKKNNSPSFLEKALKVDLTPVTRVSGSLEWRSLAFSVDRRAEGSVLG